jgi:hypothetical protein
MLLVELVRPQLCPKSPTLKERWLEHGFISLCKLHLQAGFVELS